MEIPPSIESGPDLEALKSIATLVYALQAISFFLGVTAIVGVVIDYVKRDDARGTWLASHYTWQIRTFWWGLLWAVIGMLTFFIVIGWFILLADMVWVIYRIAKGWMRLAENRTVET